MKNNSNDMALASMAIGILAIVTAFSVLGGIMLGSLAVILAWLSTGNEKMTGRGIAGMVTGLIGMVLAMVPVFVLADAVNSLSRLY